MASFPTLSSGVTVLGPLTVQDSMPVEVLRFEDNSEQRIRTAKKLFNFKLRPTSVSKADMISLRDFFISVKGNFDPTWDITIGGVLYENMVFTTEVFRAEEVTRGRYTISLECRQVK